MDLAWHGTRSSYNECEFENEAHYNKEYPSQFCVKWMEIESCRDKCVQFLWLAEIKIKINCCITYKCDES